MIEAVRRRRMGVFSTAAAAPKAGDGDGLVRVSLASLVSLHHEAEAFALQPRRVLARTGGAYLSPFRGRGMEFDEVRSYAQGDDARHIDWRVTARSGKPHTKLYREERERAVLLLIDLRPAMFFGTRGAFKAVRAAQAAALLGWNALQRGDRLGALIFDDRSHEEWRPKRGRPPFMHVLRRLASHPAWADSGKRSEDPATAAALSQALLRLHRVVQPGSAIIVLSDFSGFNGEGSADLARLARHNDLLPVRIYDPLEAELPPAGRYRVSDGRRFLSVDTGDHARRERYRREFAQRQAELQSFCRGRGIRLLSLATPDEPLAVLQRSLGGSR